MSSSFYPLLGQLPIQGGREDVRRVRRGGSPYASHGESVPVLGFGVEIEIISIQLDELVPNRPAFQLKYFEKIAENLRMEGERAFAGLDPGQAHTSKWYITEDVSLQVDRNDQGKSPKTPR